MIGLHSILGFSVWGDWSYGNFTVLDLIAATTNAFNAALLARRPDHWKHFTIVGILLLAVVGGIAGGVSRDLILGQVPAPFLNPQYILLSILAALVTLRIAYGAGQRFREGLFQFQTSLSLPWYAAVGAGMALEADLPYVAAIAIGVVASTAGRYIVDLTCGVTPKLFVRGEWFVGTAVLASVGYVVCAAGLGLSIWPATLISFTAAFLFRYTAMLRHWEEPEPSAPPELAAGETARPRIQDRLREEFHPEKGDRDG